MSDTNMPEKSDLCTQSAVDVEGFMECISDAHSGNRVEAMWIYDALKRKGYLRTPTQSVDVEKVLMCTGCGSEKSIKELQDKGCLSCCPERNMQWTPVKNTNERVQELEEKYNDVYSTCSTLAFENKELEQKLKLPMDAFNWKPKDEWHEDDGDAIWTKFPIEEPFYAGNPNDDDWTHDHFTHFILMGDICRLENTKKLHEQALQQIEGGQK